MRIDRMVMVGLAALPLVAAKGDIKSLLMFAVVGAVVGLVARLIVPGSGGMGFLVTVIVGIVGAVIGGWLAGAVWEETAGVDWISSILVAALLVWIVTRVGGRRRVV